MIDQHKLSVFKELFNQAESVLIIYSPDALRDHLFSATALYKTFQQLGNKDVTLLSSENLSKDETDIVYLNETKTEIGHKNLCITLDYDTHSVEKITSSIDEVSKKLHITIKPKKGNAPLSQKGVSFSHTGAEADMVILVGVDDLESLDNLYMGYENLYQNTTLVSINSYETSFGNLKMDILGSSCVSEYVSDLIRGLNYQLDHEVATNLLAGIDEETDKLESYLATADTFELVSYLLRNGARRFARENQSEEELAAEEDVCDVDTDIDIDAGANINANIDVGTEIDTNSNTNTNTRINTNVDAYADTDTDTDIGDVADAYTDNDTDNSDDVIVVESSELDDDNYNDENDENDLSSNEAEIFSGNLVNNAGKRMVNKKMSKKRPGRPRGSKNLKNVDGKRNLRELENAKLNNAPVLNRLKQKLKPNIKSKFKFKPKSKNNKTKPGNLNYEPSGLGPSTPSA